MRFKAFRHDLVPDAARGAIFCNFLKEIVVRVEEEGESRSKLIDVEAAAHAPFDILHAVAQGESKFLNRRRAGFANVVAADGDGIELRSVLDAEFERVDHQAHRGFWRVDVFLLRDVFLQDVVLKGAGQFFPVRALLFRDGQIHRPDDSGGRIDRHGSGDLGERNLVEEHFHVGERTDGDATLADFAFG